LRAHEHARAGGWRPRHDGTQSPGRHPASRHHANAGLGIELLAPGNSGRPHCPRSRHVEHLILRGLLCLPCRLGAGGATRCPHGGQSRLIGPSRVSARILEASLMKRFHPMVSARLSVALHPLGRSCLAHSEPERRLLCSPCYTAREAASSPSRAGQSPRLCSAPRNYGYRLGLLGAPSRLMMAAAPLLFGVLIDLYGAGALIFSSALSIAAFLGLCSLRISRERRAADPKR